MIFVYFCGFIDWYDSDLSWFDLFHAFHVGDPAPEHDALLHRSFWASSLELVQWCAVCAVQYDACCVRYSPMKRSLALSHRACTCTCTMRGFHLFQWISMLDWHTLWDTRRWRQTRNCGHQNRNGTSSSSLASGRVTVKASLSHWATLNSKIWKPRT